MELSIELLEIEVRQEVVAETDLGNWIWVSMRGTLFIYNTRMLYLMLSNSLVDFANRNIYDNTTKWFSICYTKLEFCNSGKSKISFSCGFHRLVSRVSIARGMVALILIECLNP